MHRLYVSTRPTAPRLQCARRSKESYNVTLGLLPTDLFHVIRAFAEFDVGMILPVMGYCLWTDARGEVYAVHAYVPGYGTTAAGREVLRFPSPEQQEVLFQELPPFITEVDLTDHADSLTLERLQEAVVIPMYPTAEHRRLAA